MSQSIEKHETALYRFDETELSVIVADETVWLSQKQLTELLGITRQTIGEHLSNLKAEGESVSRFYLHTAADGKSYEVEHYNLDTVIEVAFAARKSKLAKAFRAWAKSVLNLYVVRSIRFQEAIDYTRVKDFIAQSSDYNPGDSVCREYFATIQNKILFAITGKTAAELIIDRVSADVPNMGLTMWKGKQVNKADAQTAKNYLTEEELKQINALVVVIAGGAYFLMQKQTSTMRQWVDYVEQQIILFRCKLLTDRGQHSHDQAMKIVAREYEDFKLRPVTPAQLNA